MEMTSPKSITGHHTKPKSISVLGSTGSIGRNTLDLVAHEPDQFSVVALTANKNAELLAEQAKIFQPKLAVVADGGAYKELKEHLSGYDIEIAAGQDALVAAAAMQSDLLMAGIVGIAGLAPTLAGIMRGATVALANKECLVCAGNLMLDQVQQSGATMLPVDSEHNAIYQVFDFDRPETVEKLILTASGGPFRETPIDKMADVTPKEAVAHPNWDMGAKISVDSATMMNKGLELIEAYYLFPVTEPQIDILVHPQSVIHSMVSYRDGSVLAQLGSPDMRTPIAYALAWPGRMDTPAPKLELEKISQLTFEPPDIKRFPALRIARDCLVAGGAAPIVLNAANEVAVRCFLDRRIGFLEITKVVEGVLSQLNLGAPDNIADVGVIDKEARKCAETLVFQN
jgi:1-deoxy-D-xylulose-5-phosphate reductoisomerase